jgi:hypothetical protein
LNTASPNPKSNPIQDVLKISAGVILLLLFVLLAYTFLHESGHMLVGLLFGARVTSFSINFTTAHVGLDGTFAPWQNAVISAAGVSFSLILWAVFITLAPRKGTLLLEFLRLTLTLAFINPLLAWIIIPVLTLNGQVIGDDSANFLRYTQFPPLLVSAAALLVYLGAWGLFLRQIAGLGGLVQAFRSLRSQRFEFSSPQACGTLKGMLLSGVVFTAAALGLGLAFGTSRQAAIPAGYTPLGSYDLSQTSFADSIVYQVELKSPSRLSFFFTLTDIKGAPLKIRLAGPDGYDNVFFAVTDPAFKGIGTATVHPQDLALEPGVYQIHLTFPPGQGKIALYMKN